MTNFSTKSGAARAAPAAPLLTALIGIRRIILKRCLELEKVLIDVAKIVKSNEGTTVFVVDYKSSLTYISSRMSATYFCLSGHLSTSAAHMSCRSTALEKPVVALTQ